MLQAYGIFVVGGTVLCMILWVVALILLRPLKLQPLHRATIYLSIATMLLLDVVVLLASAQTFPPELIRLLFGLLVGLQLVAAMSALIFAERS
jgi:hypothetical protein